MVELNSTCCVISKDIKVLVCCTLIIIQCKQILDNLKLMKRVDMNDRDALIACLH